MGRPNYAADGRKYGAFDDKVKAANKDPNYLKLPWKTRKRFDDAMKAGDPTKKKYKRDPATSANEK